MDTKSSLLLVLMFFLIFTAPFEVRASSSTSSKEEAVAALANAEEAVASAYNATVNAERTGANISGLLARLNDAGDELSKAEVAYRQGDFNSTLNLAGICSQSAEGVKIEADQLRLEASDRQYVDIWLKMVVSIFTVVAVWLSSFGTWRIFKRRYYQRVLQMKPEAVSCES